MTIPEQISDEYGNCIDFKLKGDIKTITHSYTIYLFVKQEGRKRNIGVLQRGDNTYDYFKNLKESHKHRVTNSFGICMEIWKMLDYNSQIFIVTEAHNYQTVKKHAIKGVRFLHFKKQGFEKQVFIPLDYFSIDGKKSKYEEDNQELIDKEKKKETQMELF